LAEKRDFAKWYVEVAWQRLADRDKTDALEKHWSEYGDLKQPEYLRRPISDKYDDWLGISHLTSTWQVLKDRKREKWWHLSEWKSAVRRLRFRDKIW